MSNSKLLFCSTLREIFKSMDINDSGSVNLGEVSLFIVSFFFSVKQCVTYDEVDNDILLTFVSLSSFRRLG